MGKLRIGDSFSIRAKGDCITTYNPLWSCYKKCHQVSEIQISDGIYIFFAGLSEKSGAGKEDACRCNDGDGGDDNAAEDEVLAGSGF